MKCPHCQGHLDNPVTALRRKRRRKKLCIDCGEPLIGQDVAFIRCLVHRKKANEQAWRRRHNDEDAAEC